MKKRILSLFLVLTMLLIPACSNSSKTVENAKLTHNLTLLVTSDIHSGVEDNFTLPAIYEKRNQRQPQPLNNASRNWSQRLKH